MFDSRYMVTATFRADASSRFASNNQWGYFPSVSAGWKISNESFMQNVGWLSDLKLRASTGKLGNQEIDNYAFLTLLRRQGDQYLISRYGNPDLDGRPRRRTTSASTRLSCRTSCHLARLLREEDVRHPAARSRCLPSSATSRRRSSMPAK